MSYITRRLAADGVTVLRIVGSPIIEAKAFPRHAPAFVSLAIGEEHVGYYTLIIPDLERARAIGRALIEAADIAEGRS